MNFVEEKYITCSTGAGEEMYGYSWVFLRYLEVCPENIVLLKFLGVVISISVKQARPTVC